MEGGKLKPRITAVFLVTSLVLLDQCHCEENPLIHSEDQQEALYRKQLECIGLIAAERQNASLLNGTHCTRTWDSITCWPPTPAGQLAIQPCPSHIKHIDTTKNASRQCSEDGTWFINPFNNKTWSNFTQCGYLSQTSDNSRSVPALIEQHADSVRLMYNIGYGLSLASLVIAVIIMIYFRKLHCARNAIHINLFVSFILRAVVSFIRENLLVEFVGFPGDVYYEHGQIKFRNDVTHWECRLFFTLYNYTLAASYMWIFVEALYLQILISVSVFTEKNRTKWFMVLGWLFPLSFILPWVLVRIFEFNKLCWNTNPNKLLMFIIYGPITATVLVQFIIFINIVRVLFTKLHASSGHQTNSFRYRRLAKSTLILIPLFGVYYIIYSINFLMTTFGYLDETSMMYLILWWSELFFNSFQGFILAMLFCFLNAEVQAELKKVWHRHVINRTGSVRTTRTFLSRTRNSVKQPSQSNGNALVHSDVNDPKDQSDATLLNSLQMETNCDNETQGRVFDTEIVEDETSPCVNNNRTVGGDKNNGSCTKVTYKSEIS
ncbi:vasoactive intestinal polypeptide receptor-like isoform X2 [Ostrea edulis]|uniref:vasoactive intestinal polypeptide receptor-like isoform X2 n=1 Tax=Ostrea edulis TaxID=37623 RepID=UPI0024AF93DC|nr:vasoactive intestinal polypeptide receptor-like isoform X2 [Ostrea edulis]XP_056007436.1 vasoactive intestinal polypeptide receptor-like isoform X2 [Ostrea edulis]XP_056007437.1 vasoactive intestinal polypeptide receptor-like isoform X2 [Ostrea edulis]